MASFLSLLLIVPHDLCLKNPTWHRGLHKFSDNKSFPELHVNGHIIHFPPKHLMKYGQLNLQSAGHKENPLKHWHIQIKMEEWKTQLPKSAIMVPGLSNRHFTSHLPARDLCVECCILCSPPSICFISGPIHLFWMYLVHLGWRVYKNADR